MRYVIPGNAHFQGVWLRMINSLYIPSVPVIKNSSRFYSDKSLGAGLLPGVDVFDIFIADRR